MKQFKQLIAEVLADGLVKHSRTGMDTKSVFGKTLDFDLRGRQVPMVSSKYTGWNDIATEVVWYLRGKTTRQWLHNHKVHTWDDWTVPYNLDRDVGVASKIIRPRVHYGEPIGLGAYTPDTHEDARLALGWLDMMRRCYDTTYTDYSPEMHVSKDWHDPATYITSVKSIPHWTYKQGDWDGFILSTNYYETNEYAVNSTIWLSKEEDEFYTRGSCAIAVDLDDDNRPDVYFLKGADGRIPQASLPRLLRHHAPKDGGSSVFGWDYAPMLAPDGQLYRFLPVANGSLGPVYGYQWRHWPKYNGGEIDQIQNVIDGLQNDPHGRQHIVSAWNVAQLDDMARPPCQMTFQFYVGGRNSKELHCHVYQRSCDLFLSAPFNWASYALLTHIVADYTGLQAQRLVWTGGDVHLYEDQWDMAEQVLHKTIHPHPRLRVQNGYASRPIGELQPGVFRLDGYEHSGKMPGHVPVAQVYSDSV